MSSVARAIVLSLFACPSVSLSQAAVDDLFDAPVGSPIFDLAKTPVWLDVLSFVGGSLKDYSLESQFKKESEAATQKISTELDDSMNGYLLYVEMYADEFGTPIIPGGQLLYPIGRGTEPIDALAENMRVPQIRAPRPTAASNQSFYIWVKRRSGILGAWRIPREFRDRLESQAHEEAVRRGDLGAWERANATTGLKEVQRSAYWAEVARNHEAALKTEAAKRERDRLASEFKQVEGRFNESYKKLHELAGEIAEAQNRRATLQAISAGASILGEAISTANALFTPAGDSSKNQTSPKTTGSPELGLKQSITYESTYIDKKNGIYTQERLTFQSRRDAMLRSNDALQGFWQQHNVVVPKADDNATAPAFP